MGIMAVQSGAFSPARESDPEYMTFVCASVASAGYVCNNAFSGGRAACLEDWFQTFSNKKTNCWFDINLFIIALKSTIVHCILLSCMTL